MFDFQAVYMREIVPLRDVTVLTVLRYDLPEAPSAITDVTLAGTVTPYIYIPGGTLLVALPDALASRGAIGDVRVVSGWTVQYATVDTAGVHTLHTVDSSILPGQGALLRLLVDNPTVVEEVWLNGRQVPFTRTAGKAVLCSVPSGATTIENINIIANTETISRAQLFAYFVAPHRSVVTGPTKMLAQFVKLLHTTPGTDIFNPSSGGGVRKLIGGNANDAGGSTLAAAAMQAVALTAAQMQLSQLRGSLPANERLMSASVVQVTTNDADPTVVGMVLQLKSFAQSTSQFSLLLNK